MKTHMTKVVAALAALALTAGCGGGGSLPTDKDPVIDDPGPADPGNPPPASATSLWPLTTGSTWTYAITDDVYGKFDKVVTVKGPGEVPGMPGTQAIQVESVQFRTPSYTERSWQQDSDGIVRRLREEDRSDGDLLRVTMWSPATLKSISQLRELSWSYEQGPVTEQTSFGEGTTPTSEPVKPYIWRVMAVNETVEVPAGKFTNALRLQRDRTDKEKTPKVYWLVPGVGKVKETGDRTEELRSYTIVP
jgi:hypothetical protein